MPRRSSRATRPPPTLARRDGLATLPSQQTRISAAVKGTRRRLSLIGAKQLQLARLQLRRWSESEADPELSAAQACRRCSAPARLDSAELDLVPWKNVTLRGSIGSGASADVYEAEVRLPEGGGKKHVVAVKLFRASRASASALHAEARLLHGLRHPCVVATLGVTSDGGLYHGLLLERMRLSFSQLLESAGAPLSWETPGPLRLICADVARGMAFLHGLGILHRDLKPANVLLADGGARECDATGSPYYRAKVADFGSARRTDPAESLTLTALRGTPAYMAPEVVRRERYDASADVWSFGCLVVAAATRRHPYLDILAAPGASVEGVLRAVACGEARPTTCVPEGAWPSRAARELAEMCTVQLRDERPSFAEIGRRLVGQGLSTFQLREGYFGGPAFSSTLVSATI